MVPVVSTKTLPLLKPSSTTLPQSSSVLNLVSQLKSQDFSDISKDTPAKFKGKVPHKLLFVGPS